MTRRPTDAWVTQQLREATPYGACPRFLVRDNDTKYGRRFDQVVAASGITVLRTPVRAPRANTITKRFLRSIRRECVDHLLREYVAYFNQARPHQGLGQRVPVSSS